MDPSRSERRPVVPSEHGGVGTTRSRGKANLPGPRSGSRPGEMIALTDSSRFESRSPPRGEHRSDRSRISSGSRGPRSARLPSSKDGRLTSCDGGSCYASGASYVRPCGDPSLDGGWPYALLLGLSGDSDPLVNGGNSHVGKRCILLRLTQPYKTLLIPNDHARRRGSALPIAGAAGAAEAARIGSSPSGVPQWRHRIVQGWGRRPTRAGQPLRIRWSVPRTTPPRSSVASTGMASVTRP